MNRFFLLAFSLLISALAANAQSESTDSEADNALAVDSSVMEYAMESADGHSSNSQTKTTRQIKSGSSSNGNKEVYVYPSIKNLAVFPLIKKYKRNKATELSVIQNTPNRVFLTLEVRGDAAIVKEVNALVEKDKKNCASTISKYNENNDEYIIRLQTEDGDCTLMYTVDVDGNRCSLSISGASGILDI